MELKHPLYTGTLLKRYKRFLADVELDNGEKVTAHCPNSGSMKGCSVPGSKVLLSISDNPKRKLKYTWELIQKGSIWIGVNTILPNKLVREAIKDGLIDELQGYNSIRPEVKYGRNSRIDLLIDGPKGLCYVEVKNVTLVEDNVAFFPDAVTTRGQKHMHELMNMVKKGYRSVVFFVVQRKDGKIFAPADNIDPEYGRLLRKALKSGIEVLAYQASVSPSTISISHSLPIKI